MHPIKILKIAFSLTLTACSLLVTNAHSQTNLLVNPTFTGNSTSGWTITNFESAYASSGAFYAYQNAGTGSLSQFITGSAGTYTVSGAFNFSYSLSNTMSIKLGDSATTSLTGSTLNTSTNFSIRLATTTANPNILFYIGTIPGGGTPSWENLSVIYLIEGPSTANTQTSLVNTATSLQNIYSLQNSVLANSFSYDCTLFDRNDICISAGGRNTAIQAANGLNNNSGLLIVSYRALPNVRIGAYADQNLSVNNAGSTVSLGNNTPLIGLFGAWNERLDGTGTEVKVSAAYGQKNAAVTRAVVGSGSTASEAGTGSSQLNSQGAQLTAKYGFEVAEDVIVSPYMGMRYTQNNMGGYAESTSSAVTAPLTYSALNTNATTALAGVGASYRGIPQTTLFASTGVETDTNTANGSYSATGISGLTPINFNTNPVQTRPTAMIGATYDVEKNQRLGITGIYRQEPYQGVSQTSVMATYTVGL